MSFVRCPDVSHLFSTVFDSAEDLHLLPKLNKINDESVLRFQINFNWRASDNLISKNRANVKAGYIQKMCRIRHKKVGNLQERCVKIETCIKDVTFCGFFTSNFKTWPFGLWEPSAKDSRRTTPVGALMRFQQILG